MNLSTSAAVNDSEHREGFEAPSGSSNRVKGAALVGTELAGGRTDRIGCLQLMSTAYLRAAVFGAPFENRAACLFPARFFSFCSFVNCSTPAVNVPTIAVSLSTLNESAFLAHRPFDRQQADDQQK